MHFQLKIYSYEQKSIYNVLNLGPVEINNSKTINAQLLFSKKCQCHLKNHCKTQLLHRFCR